MAPMRTVMGRALTTWAWCAVLPATCAIVGTACLPGLEGSALYFGTALGYVCMWVFGITTPAQWGNTVVASREPYEGRGGLRVVPSHRLRKPARR